MSLKWTALQDAIAVVRMLAGLGAEPASAQVRDFPALMRDLGGLRLQRAAQAVDDLTAVMEPGLTALLALHGRGADPAAAATALWREFDAARTAMLALAPPA